MRRRGSGGQARFYDEKGTRRTLAGFATQTAAFARLDDKVKEAAALRRGDLAPVPDRPQTVNAPRVRRRFTGSFVES